MKSGRSVQEDRRFPAGNSSCEPPRDAAKGEKKKLKKFFWSRRRRKIEEGRANFFLVFKSWHPFLPTFLTHTLCLCTTNGNTISAGDRLELVSDVSPVNMNRSITGAWANQRNKISLNSPLPPSSPSTSSAASTIPIPPPPGSAAAAALARQQQAQAQQNGDATVEQGDAHAAASPVASGSAPRTRQGSPNPALVASTSSPVKRKSRSSRIDGSGAAGSSTGSSSSKRPKGLISKLMNTAEKYTPPATRLADLGGISHAIEKILELIAMPLCHPEIYAHTGVKPPRGVLLHGPPGCGKTMLAGAVAGELGVPFLSISAPSVVSGTSGESEKTIRDTFDEAASIAPCILFIDEIDAITPKRETAQREMERRIVAQLLTSLDDLSWEKTDGKPVMVIGATNRPDSLDPALRRAGRFDHEIAMGVPDEDGREQ